MNNLFRNGTTVLVSAFLFAAWSAHPAVNVTQYHNHLSRDGLYIDPGFTLPNVTNSTRDLNFNGAISGQVYAQPLYIENGPRGRAVIIAVTQSNDVYALDAYTGLIAWETNAAPPTPYGVLPCGDVSPTFGIFGTPVVDLQSRALFFDAETVAFSGTVEHLVYSLNVDTGALNPGWPVNVNSNAFYNNIAFASLSQGQRGALMVVSGNVYIPYGGLQGDCGTYHGWVVGIPINDPSTVMAWATSADKGGIWAVNGISSDGTDVFAATGNTYQATSWGGGEAVLHLTPDLVLPAGTTNYWAPTNWSGLDQGDMDIGSSGALLVDVPGANPSNLVVALGKDGNMYLLNRTNLGGITQPVWQQRIVGGTPIQAPATYRTTNGTHFVFQFNSDTYNLLINATDPPTIRLEWYYPGFSQGSPFVTSTGCDMRLLEQLFVMDTS